FKPTANKMLLLIAATNRPWALDSAMLRGGRFDTQIYVGVPDQEAREFLVHKVLDGIEKEEDVDLSKLSWALEGYGGGDVTAICERIKLEPYKREVATGIPQKITRDDCNKILTNSRNVITDEEIEKFELYKEGKYGI
ncbi:MAG: ATP-binding protein, partial [Firmicutes bacterium]|nr:ATP-binding protein [Candidatus Caballimonas caccae]